MCRAFRALNICFGCIWIVYFVSAIFFLLLGGFYLHVHSARSAYSALLWQGQSNFFSSLDDDTTSPLFFCSQLYTTHTHPAPILISSINRMHGINVWGTSHYTTSDSRQSVAYSKKYQNVRSNYISYHLWSSVLWMDSNEWTNARSASVTTAHQVSRWTHLDGLYGLRCLKRQRSERPHVMGELMVKSCYQDVLSRVRVYGILDTKEVRHTDAHSKSNNPTILYIMR